MLVLTNENKEIIKKYEEMWNKIRDLINLTTKNSDDCDEKCMTVKFNLEDDLTLNKAIEIHSMVIVGRAVFHENKKYYRQVFLDEFLNYE